MPLSKVMKYELTYIDGCGDFHNMQKEMWNLQRQSREILNQTIQEAFHWDYLQNKSKKENGKYLDVKETTGYKRLDGYIYDQLKNTFPNVSSSNLNATIQKAWKKYKDAQKEIYKGEMSVPSYKKDQPIVLDKGNVNIEKVSSGYLLRLTVFSKGYKKTNGYDNLSFSFRACDKTQKVILERLNSTEYKHGNCQLIYEDKKWFLYLTYNFDTVQEKLDDDKILGVDLGVKLAVVASVIGEKGRLVISGGEVSGFAAELEKRRRERQRQAAYCGDGRIGHGVNTRLEPVYRDKEKIANFRDTINHRYSKEVVDYAIKCGCGVIQMEDLTAIKENNKNAKMLRHWTYYDLQSKIEAKAKEVGIKVKKVNPQFTSQRCSRCGAINKENRPEQSTFCCVNCGYSENADYNASQNLSIKDIDKIIKMTGANSEWT